MALDEINSNFLSAEECNKLLEELEKNMKGLRTKGEEKLNPLL